MAMNLAETKNFGDDSNWIDNDTFMFRFSTTSSNVDLAGENWKISTEFCTDSLSIGIEILRENVYIGQITSQKQIYVKNISIHPEKNIPLTLHNVSVHSDAMGDLSSPRKLNKIEVVAIPCYKVNATLFKAKDKIRLYWNSKDYYISEDKFDIGDGDGTVYYLKITGVKRHSVNFVKSQNIENTNLGFNVIKLEEMKLEDSAMCD